MNVLRLVIALAVPLGVGAVASLATAPAVDGWYQTLTKPAVNPPSWLFAPVWTALYVLMGVAAYLVWRAGIERRDVRRALLLFLAQLALNGVWSFLFFSFQQPFWALIDIVLLGVAIVLTMYAFWPVSRVATYLLAPYLAWVLFASYLNAAIVVLN